MKYEKVNRAFIKVNENWIDKKIAILTKLRASVNKARKSLESGLDTIIEVYNKDYGVTDSAGHSADKKKILRLFDDGYYLDVKDYVKAFANQYTPPSGATPRVSPNRVAAKIVSELTALMNAEYKAQENL